MDTARIVAQLKILPVYTCHGCNAQVAGTTKHLDLDVSTPQQLADTIKSQPLRSADMPYGWSFNGHFNCLSCGGSK